MTMFGFLPTRELRHGHAGLAFALLLLLLLTLLYAILRYLRYTTLHNWIFDNARVRAEVIYSVLFQVPLTMVYPICAS
jgi:hypothetical protein